MESMERQQGTVQSVCVESYKRSQSSHNAPSSDDSGRWQQPPIRPAVTMYRSGADSVYSPANTGCHSLLGVMGKPGGNSSGHGEATLRQPQDSPSAIQSSGRSMRGHSPVNSPQTQSGHASGHASGHTCVIQQQAAPHARAQAAAIPAGTNRIHSLPVTAQFSRNVAGNHQYVSSSRLPPEQHRQLRPTPPAPLAEHRASLTGTSSRTQHAAVDCRTPSHGSLTATTPHRSQIAATHGASTQYRSSATSATPSTRPVSSRSRILGQSRSRSTSRTAQSSSASQPLNTIHSGTPTTRFVHAGASCHASASAHRRDTTGAAPSVTTTSSAMSTMSIGSSMCTTPAAMSTQRSTIHPSDTPRHDHRRNISDASGSGSAAMNTQRSTIHPSDTPRHDHSRGISDASGSGSAAMETLSESSGSAIHHAQQQQQHHTSQQMQYAAPLTRHHSRGSQQSMQLSASLVRHPSARAGIQAQLQLPPQPALERLRIKIGALPYIQDVAREGYGVVGLRNLGNTCFMNSMLQCLAAVPDLLRFVVSRGFIQEKKGSFLTPAYKDLMRALALGPHESVSPSGFLGKMQRVSDKWGARAQQDSHEFLLALLDRLQTEGDRNSHKPQYRELVGKGSVAEQAATAAAYAREWTDSWIDDTFGGLLQSTVECQRCGDKSFRFDTCLDVSVPLPSARESSAKFGPDGVPLEHCLRKFIQPEVLDVEYKCEGCGHVTSRKKWLQLFTPPRTLVLHLNRFSQGGVSDGFGGSPFTGMRKNSTAVNVPSKLDMSQCCSSLGMTAASNVIGATPYYRLIAVSEHSGGMGGGHYTATTRCAADKLWYGFNDSTVSGPSKQPPCGPSSSAYVLFYKMCTISTAR